MRKKTKIYDNKTDLKKSNNLFNALKKSDNFSKKTSDNNNNLLSYVLFFLIIRAPKKKLLKKGGISFLTKNIHLNFNLKNALTRLYERFKHKGTLKQKKIRSLFYSKFCYNKIVLKKKIRQKFLPTITKIPGLKKIKKKVFVKKIILKGEVEKKYTLMCLAKKITVNMLKHQIKTKAEKKQIMKNNNPKNENFSLVLHVFGYRRGFRDKDKIDKQLLKESNFKIFKQFLKIYPTVKLYLKNIYKKKLKKTPHSKKKQKKQVFFNSVSKKIALGEKNRQMELFEAFLSATIGSRLKKIIKKRPKPVVYGLFKKKPVVLKKKYIKRVKPKKITSSEKSVDIISKETQLHGQKRSKKEKYSFEKPKKKNFFLFDKNLSVENVIQSLDGMITPARPKQESVKKREINKKHLHLNAPLEVVKKNQINTMFIKPTKVLQKPEKNNKQKHSHFNETYTYPKSIQEPRKKFEKNNELKQSHLNASLKRTERNLDVITAPLKFTHEPSRRFKENDEQKHSQFNVPLKKVVRNFDKKYAYTKSTQEPRKKFEKNNEPRPAHLNIPLKKSESNLNAIPAPIKFTQEPLRRLEKNNTQKHSHFNAPLKKIEKNFDKTYADTQSTQRPRKKFEKNNEPRRSHLDVPLKRTESDLNVTPAPIKFAQEPSRRLEKNDKQKSPHVKVPLEKIARNFDETRADIKSRQEPLKKLEKNSEPRQSHLKVHLKKVEKSSNKVSKHSVSPQRPQKKLDQHIEQKQPYLKTIPAPLEFTKKHRENPKNGDKPDSLQLGKPFTIKKS